MSTAGNRSRDIHEISIINENTPVSSSGDGLISGNLFHLTPTSIFECNFNHLLFLALRIFMADCLKYVAVIVISRPDLLALRDITLRKILEVNLVHPSAICFLSVAIKRPMSYRGHYFIRTRLYLSTCEKLRTYNQNEM